eukprot:Nk52_evm16s316 gene=Nk52_evmTU16s316
MLNITMEDLPLSISVLLSFLPLHLLLDSSSSEPPPEGYDHAQDSYRSLHDNVPSTASPAATLLDGAPSSSLPSASMSSALPAVPSASLHDAASSLSSSSLSSSSPSPSVASLSPPLSAASLTPSYQHSSGSSSTSLPALKDISQVDVCIGLVLLAAILVMCVRMAWCTYADDIDWVFSDKQQKQKQQQQQQQQGNHRHNSTTSSSKID